MHKGIEPEPKTSPSTGRLRASAASTRRFSTTAAAATTSAADDNAADAKDDVAASDVKEGMAAAWQLRPDDVVLLAGCLPPAQASRYFAATPYLYAAHNNKVPEL